MQTHSRSPVSSSLTKSSGHHCKCYTFQRCASVLPQAPIERYIHPRHASLPPLKAFTIPLKPSQLPRTKQTQALLPPHPWVWQTNHHHSRLPTGASNSPLLKIGQPPQAPQNHHHSHLTEAAPNPQHNLSPPPPPFHSHTHHAPLPHKTRTHDTSRLCTIPHLNHSSPSHPEANQPTQPSTSRNLNTTYDKKTPKMPSGTFTFVIQIHIVKGKTEDTFIHAQKQNHVATFSPPPQWWDHGYQNPRLHPYRRLPYLLAYRPYRPCLLAYHPHRLHHPHPGTSSL